MPVSSASSPRPLSDRSPTGRDAAEHGVAGGEPFAGDPWFQGLPLERRRALMRHARLRRYAPGERLYRIGDGADGLYGIVSGFVRLVSYPEAGRELVAGVMSGGWFGEVAVLDGGVRPHDAIASGDVVVAKLGLFAWQALARETPAFTADLARLGCLHIRRQMAEIDALMTFGSEGRLSRLLVQLGDAGKRDSGRCRIELSQTSLADLTGISRQHLNRLLRVMEAERLIRIGYSCIEVLDPARLLVHDGR